MKRTITQTICDVCGKPTEHPGEVTLKQQANSPGRPSSFDVCRRHFRSVVKALKVSTSQDGRLIPSRKSEGGNAEEEA